MIFIAKIQEIKTIYLMQRMCMEQMCDCCRLTEKIGLSIQLENMVLWNKYVIVKDWS